MKTVIVCENLRHFESVYAPAVLERLKAQTDCDGRCYRKADILEQPAAFADTEVLFSTWGMPAFTEEEIRTYLPALRCVFYAAGTVQGFARPFLQCGVRVFSARAANAVPVAEYTVAQIVLAGKDFFCQSRLLANGGRDAAAARRGTHIGNYRKRVGLIGCGTIGTLVAQRLQAYDMEVLVYDPYLSVDRAAQLRVTPCSLETLFSSCAVVSNHLPNTEKTRGMLRYAHFASMPPYATFLNTGRGAQVEEDGLVKALTERPDLTAVLDVTDPEPSPAGHPFYTLANCFLTPHIAGSLGNEVIRMAEYMLEEYERYQSGQDCPHEVLLAMLETMA